MENWTHRDIFDAAWKHFEVVAQQRLQTFNFYVVLLVATVGASLTALEKHAEIFVIFICGLVCIGAGVTFLILEIRTRRLLQIPKNVMTALEIGDHWPESLRLFSIDNLRQEGFLKSIVSYSAAIRTTMSAHILFGVVLLFLGFCPALNPNLSSQNKERNASPIKSSQAASGNVLKTSN